MLNLLPISFLSLFVLAACQTTDSGGASDGSSDVERTWQAAAVSVPLEFNTAGKYHITEPNTGIALIDEINRNVRKGAKIPTVIYLHGSAGAGPSDADFERAALNAGYAVIVPKHFRRAAPNGYIGLHTTRSNTPLDIDIAYAQRLEELEHALSQLPTIPWVDMKNIVIAGTSMGGITVRFFPARQPKINGVMIFSGLCYGHYAKRGTMIEAGEGVHILYVLGTEDHYWLSHSNAEPCFDPIADRPQPSTQTTVVAGNNVIGLAEVQEMIVSHLKAWHR